VCVGYIIAIVIDTICTSTVHTKLTVEDTIVCEIKWAGQGKCAHSAQFIVSLKTIRYSSIKHSQVLFKYDYMFQSKKIIIRPTLQKLLKW